MLAKVRSLGLAGLLATAVIVSGAVPTRPALAAPQISNIVFSSSVGSNWQPTGDIGIEFGKDNDGVIVSFDFQDMPANARLSRIVRFNGEDYNWDGNRYGRLNCCPAGVSGRFGFEVQRLSGGGGELPGGAYEVHIYLNDVEIASSGFGIRGTKGKNRDIPGGRPTLDKD